MPRLALYSLILCVLALAAAVLSFMRGSMLMGVVWLLMTGVSSNLCWFYFKRGRDERRGSAAG